MNCATHAPDTVDPRVREALAAEGFGVLSDIDVQAALPDNLSLSAGDGLTDIAADAKQRLQRALGTLGYESQ